MKTRAAGGEIRVYIVIRKVRPGCLLMDPQSGDMSERINRCYSIQASQARLEQGLLYRYSVIAY